MEYKQIIDEFKELIKTKKGKSKKPTNKNLINLLKLMKKEKRKLK